MPPYKGPETGLNRSVDPSVSWYRIGNKIFDDGGDQKIKHNNLADNDGNLGNVQQMKQENRTEVDAGLYKVDSKTRELILFYYSDTLDLPVDEGARARSVEVFQQQSSGYTVASQ